MKRLLAMIICVVMAVSLLAGCGSTSAPATTTTAPAAPAADAEPAAEPVVKDETRSYSIADEYEPWVWEVAVNNENFRKAIFCGINRATTLYVATGDETLADVYLQNTVTPAGLAVDDNGVDYVDNAAFAELNAKDFFDAAAAVSYRDAAMAELSAQGVSFPVKVLVRYNPTVNNWEEQCTLLEQQLEAVLNADGTQFVDVIVVAGPTEGFLGAVRRSSDYMLMLCNWGADYADPETFSEPFYQAKSDTSPNGYNRGGRYAYFAYSVSDGMASSDTVLEYFDLVEAAMAITDDTNARYDAFAKAEAYMIEHALVIPYGTEVADYVASRLNPFEGQYAGFGISNARYKGQHLLDNFMSMEEYSAAAEGQAITSYTDTDNDTYRVLYSGELTTINYLTTGNSNEHAIGANVIDSLVEYDCNGEIHPSLATEWTYDADTLTWTFKLRDDASWVDTKGNVVAAVTANDFVSAAKYVLDPAMGSSTANIIYDVIANAEEYFNYMTYLQNAEAGVVDEDGTTYTVDEEGNVTVTPAEGEAAVYAPVSFEEVGVKAVDDTTLQYTLKKEVPYFVSMMTYVTYLPAYGPQLEELGTKFATSADTMYYCGAYYISDYQPQVKLVLSKNTTNWDAEKVYIETINRIFNAEASTIGAEMAKRGEIDYTSLSADIVDAWLADPATANMVSMERPASDFAYYYCFNFNVGALDETFYRP